MFNSLIKFSKAFNSEESCSKYLIQKRFGDKLHCIKCESTKVYPLKDGKRLKCISCDKVFSIRIGTIFESSRIPLTKWFLAIYLTLSHKKGLSSIQLAKEIDVTQKSAWFMQHRIRKAFKSTSDALLEGIVEVDETYIGGKEKNKHASKRVKGTQGRSTKTKALVLGMLQRGGALRFFHIKDASGKTIRSHVNANILEGTRIMSDEHGVYKTLGSKYVHEAVNHSMGIYGIGDVTTNGIESAFAVLKKIIGGVYHHVSRKHLHRYLDDVSYRQNTKKVQEKFDAFLEKIEVRLKWTELIA